MRYLLLPFLLLVSHISAQDMSRFVYGDKQEGVLVSQEKEGRYRYTEIQGYFDGSASGVTVRAEWKRDKLQRIIYFDTDNVPYSNQVHAIILDFEEEELQFKEDFNKAQRSGTYDVHTYCSLSLTWDGENSNPYLASRTEAAKYYTEGVSEKTYNLYSCYQRNESNPDICHEIYYYAKSGNPSTYAGLFLRNNKTNIHKPYLGAFYNKVQDATACGWQHQPYGKSFMLRRWFNEDNTQPKIQIGQVGEDRFYSRASFVEINGNDIQYVLTKEGRHLTRWVSISEYLAQPMPLNE